MQPLGFIDPLVLRSIEKEVERNPLIFRGMMRSALADYTKEMRDRDQQIGAMAEVYQMWHRDVLPARRTIEATREAVRLKTSLDKNLLLSSDEGDELIEGLVADRLSRLNDEFMARLPATKRKKTAQALRAFLRQTVEQIMTQGEVYERALAYREAATSHSIHVYDAGLTSRRKRRQSRRLDKKEVARYRQQIQEQLIDVASSIREIRQIERGLLGQILGYELDLVEVYAARQSYEKRLAKLKKADRESPSKQMMLFTSETATIRDTYAARGVQMKSLSNTQLALKELDTILMTIFDLDNERRNELMAKLGEYRALLRTEQRLRAILETDLLESL